MITHDGLLNLQAKNLTQRANGDSAADEPQKSLDFNSVFTNLTAKEMVKFSKITRLNLSSNKIFQISSEFCKVLINVESLDLRSNRIREISPHIRAMKSIKILKLDKNELKSLPEELFEIKILEELTFQ